MKCEICHENEAEQVFFRTLENGKRVELYVCRGCAERERVFGQERGIQVATMEEEAPSVADVMEGAQEAGPIPGLPASMGRGFQEAFEQLAEKLQEMGITPPAMGSGEVCERCKMPLDEIRLNGRIGCKHCLEQFRSTIVSMVEEAQGVRPEEGDVAGAMSREERRLQAALRAAIASEDYVRAKALDGQLKALPEASSQEVLVERVAERPWFTASRPKAEAALSMVACRSQISLVRNLEHEIFTPQMKVRAAMGLGRDLAAYFCEHEGGEDVTGDAFWREVVGPRYGLATPEDRSPAYRLVKVALGGETLWIELMSANHITFSMVVMGAQLEVATAQLEAFVERVGRQLAFAKDAELGFVATQLPLMGSGLRVRTWMHLNALSRFHFLTPLSNAMEALGVYVEMEEERLPDGHLYILFNRSAIHAPVREIVRGFVEALQLAAWHEMNARRRFVREHPHEVRDLLDGIQAHCQVRWLFSEREAMFLLSDLRMAASVKVFAPRSLRRLFAVSPWFWVMQEALLPHEVPAKVLAQWMAGAPRYFDERPGMKVALCRGCWLRKFVKFSYSDAFLSWLMATMVDESEV